MRHCSVVLAIILRSETLLSKHTNLASIRDKGEGKVHPRTGNEGPVGEYRYTSTLSLSSALVGVGGERHGTAALPRKRPGTNCTGGWVGLKASYDGCGKSCLHQYSILVRFSP